MINHFLKLLRLPSLLFFATVLLLACYQAPVKKTESLPVSGNGYSAVWGEHRAAIASVNPLATTAGIEALNKGGNAIDAALAVAFTLGVVDSHNSGVGGGCFILARLADGTVLAIDGREMAPAAAHRDMYIIDGKAQKDLSKVGALASGIPGSVAALYELQQRGGKLSFADVLLPAAELAEQGFAIDKTLAMRLERTSPAMQQFPASSEIFLPEGKVLASGDILKQKDLARSYRKLAEQGPNWFYKGEFATLTEQWMQANGGVIRASDFANYHTVLRKPVRSEFKGYTILGFPPPSSGGVHVAQMLNMLSNYELGALTEADRYHLLIEVMKRAFADRAHWLGDSDFVPVPAGLIDEAYARQLIQSIDMKKASPKVEHGTPLNAASDLLNKHTTHLATADAEGNWVAITTTLNTSFGSKVVVPGTGILLNNQMDDFSIQPGVPNAFGLVGSEANGVAPGKRPLSSMSPTLVLENGQPVMSVGAAGGPTIINQVLQSLVRALVYSEPMDKAIAGLRVHQQWQPPLVFIESALSQEVRNELEARGHQLKEMGSFGGTQGISWIDGKFLPVTEPRVIERNQN